MVECFVPMVDEEVKDQPIKVEKVESLIIRLTPVIDPSLSMYLEMSREDLKAPNVILLGDRMLRRCWRLEAEAPDHPSGVMLSFKLNDRAFEARFRALEIHTFSLEVPEMGQKGLWGGRIRIFPSEFTSMRLTDGWKTIMKVFEKFTHETAAAVRIRREMNRRNVGIDAFWDDYEEIQDRRLEGRG